MLPNRQNEEPDLRQALFRLIGQSHCCDIDIALISSQSLVAAVLPVYHPAVLRLACLLVLHQV
jgi:hypothetical protein